MEPARKVKGRTEAGGRAAAIPVLEMLNLRKIAERNPGGEADRARGTVAEMAAGKAAAGAAHKTDAPIAGGAKMPGMDGTGPIGGGPMTGGGWGRCNSADVGANPPIVSGAGRRRGFGGPFGGGNGRRRGRCRALRQPMVFRPDDPMAPTAEIEKLQTVTETLTETLDRLKHLIGQLRRNASEQQ